MGPFNEMILNHRIVRQYQFEVSTPYMRTHLSKDTHVQLYAFLFRHVFIRMQVWADEELEFHGKNIYKGY